MRSPQDQRPTAAKISEPSVHPATIGKMSRIETYLHQPWNRPKARKPSALATSSTGIVFHKLETNSGGMAKSNRST